MKNITVIVVPDINGNDVEHIVIDRGNNEFTSMPKSIWDEQQAAKEASGTLS